jgi:hypothetical protein
MEKIISVEGLLQDYWDQSIGLEIGDVNVRELLLKSKFMSGYVRLTLELLPTPNHDESV